MLQQQDGFVQEEVPIEPKLRELKDMSCPKKVINYANIKQNLKMPSEYLFKGTLTHINVKYSPDYFYNVFNCGRQLLKPHLPW
jgi:hypothetical protein